MKSVFFFMKSEMKSVYNSTTQSQHVDKRKVRRLLMLAVLVHVYDVVGVFVYVFVYVSPKCFFHVKCFHSHGSCG